MSAPTIKRRRTKAIGPDSAVMAKAFTHKSVITTNRSGMTVKKNILVPLVPAKPLDNNEDTHASSSTPIPVNNYDEPMEVPDWNENMNNQKKSKVS